VIGFCTLHMAKTDTDHRPPDNTMSLKKFATQLEGSATSQQPSEKTLCQEHGSIQYRSIAYPASFGTL